MQRLTPTHINTTRTLVVWCIRSVAVVLLVVGGYLFLKKFFFAIGLSTSGNPSYAFFHMFRVYNEIGEGQSTYRGLAMLVVGLVLARGAKRIARWMIAMPATGCPRCGYDGAVNTICPECGLCGLEAGKALDAAGETDTNPV